MRAYATANTANSIPNDNHSDLKRTSSIMIKKSYRKLTYFPTGDYYVFFMEDFLFCNKDSSDGFIGQSPVGKVVNFAIKTCRHRLTQGTKVAGLSACPEVVTNGEYAHSPFTEKVPSFCTDD